MKRPEEPFEFPILAEKSVSFLVRIFRFFVFFFFGDHLVLGGKSVKAFEFLKSVSISVKTFFFFFFGDHLFWRKNPSQLRMNRLILIQEQ